jgi:predicted ATPase/DNA-binding SARP family transcriptional activator
MTTEGLRLRLLGGAGVLRGGKPLTGFYSNKARALLFYLAVAGRRPAGTAHARPALAGLLWADMPEPKALTNLRQALANLRKLVGGHLHITRRAVAFDRDSPYWLDVEAFEAGLADAANAADEVEPAAGAAALPRLRAAVDLYRGDFLAGFYVRDAPLFEEWMLARQTQLRAAALDALHSLTNDYARRSDYENGIAYTRRLLALEPWHEGAHRRMMLLLARSGQRSAALAHFETCRQVLREELGVEPDRETRLLSERIRAGRLARVPVERPRMVALPVPLTPLVGRKTEQRELATLLSDPQCRLVTVVGPGGVGKTRLAQATALAVAADFPDGAVFVPLESISSTDEVIPALGDAMRFPFQGGQPTQEQLAAYLREKKLLIVLDNYEHLLPGTGILTELLQHAPGLTILVTSRHRLGSRAEWVYDLDGLAYPAEETCDSLDTYDAVQLFVQRGRQIARGFTLSAERAPAVARICRLTEGIPLAIELAAAGLRHQRCDRIAAQLESGLQSSSPAFSDLPERQRSLLAIFDYSWELLAPEEQRAFSWLSVFRGGFDGRAAANVAGTSLPALHGLLDKSLLRPLPHGRFQMHALARRYAEGKLQGRRESDQARDRHLHYYLELAEQGERGLRGGDQKAWMDRLKADHGNLSAAIEWGLASDVEAGARLISANWLFWFIQGYLAEGQQHYEAALRRRSELTAPVLIRVLTGCTAMVWIQGDMARTADLAHESLRLSREQRDAEGIALSLHHMAVAGQVRGDLKQSHACAAEGLLHARTLGETWVASILLQTLGEGLRMQGRHEAAKAAFTEQLILCRKRQDDFTAIYGRDSLAQIAFQQGDLAGARTHYEEALALARAFDDRRMIAAVLMGLGCVALSGGDLPRAASLLEEALEQAHDFGDRQLSADIFRSLGDVAVERGQPTEAALYYQRGSELYQQIGDQPGIASCLDRVAALARLRGETRRALRLLAAAQSFRERLGLQRLGDEQARFEEGLAALRAQLDPESFEEEWSAGRATPAAEALIPPPKAR